MQNRQFKVFARRKDQFIRLAINAAAYFGHQLVCFRLLPLSSPSMSELSDLKPEFTVAQGAPFQRVRAFP